MIRKQIITQWVTLASAHRDANKTVIAMYGGPDVDESDDTTGFVRQRNEAAAAIRYFEAAMTPEELDLITGKSVSEVREWLGWEPKPAHTLE